MAANISVVGREHPIATRWSWSQTQILSVSSRLMRLLLSVQTLNYIVFDMLNRIETGWLIRMREVSQLDQVMIKARFHMITSTYLRICILVNIICWIVMPLGTNSYSATRKHIIADDPSNATYILDEYSIRLQNGYYEATAAPDSASKVKASMFSEPVYGDIDKDGDKDAVMFIVFEPGGSGTFFYVALAINTEGGFYGTTAVLLGDRIKPINLIVRNSMVLATFADRSPSQPMATKPTIDKTNYLIFYEGQLFLTPGAGDKSRVFNGWVVIGHEVRSFRPCSAGTELWLTGQSPVLETITTEYRKKIMRSEQPYAPLFTTLIGQIVDAPDQGFGANYPGALHVYRLIELRAQGGCENDLIVVDTPQPGDRISSPLRVFGRARGTWFFEGDFPIILHNARNTLIAQGYCTAKGNWMTEQFIPFEGMLVFDKRDSIDRGFLVFKKDNPTGNTLFDDSLPIPVIIE